MHLIKYRAIRIKKFQALASQTLCDKFSVGKILFLIFHHKLVRLVFNSLLQKQNFVVIIADKREALQASKAFKAQELKKLKKAQNLDFV